MNELQKEFYNELKKSPDAPVAEVVVKTLTAVLERSTATTMMGLLDEMQHAADDLMKVNEDSTSLSSACALFGRYVTRTSYDMPDMSKCKAKIIARGKAFAESASLKKTRIAELGSEFVRDGSVVLTHSYSRVVAAILLAANRESKHFSVIVTESRPDSSGYRLAEALRNVGVPVRIILDAAVGKVMEEVDMVLLGAEGVVESGGIINKIGTYPIAIVANAFNIPFYVAAESFKFARHYPLDQKDYPCANFFLEEAAIVDHSSPDDDYICLRTRLIPAELGANDGQDSGSHLLPLGDGEDAPNEDPAKDLVLPTEVYSVDYTPPKFISLLITDVGILTPSAVSDELIKQYY